MEQAKLSLDTSINLNLLNERDNPDVTIYQDNNNNLYQVNFYKKKKIIYINCHNTSKETDKVYSYELSLEEVQQTKVFNSFDQILTFFKGLNEDISKWEVEKGTDFILLKITINKDSILNLRLIKEMKSLKDIINQIKNLIQENENLKSRISKLNY